MRAGLLAFAVIISPLVACSFLIDTSLEDGYPCQIEEPRCLDGFICIDGICERDSDDPSWDPCEGACGEDERCERATATCVPICEGVICGTGEVCLPSEGKCTPIIAGLGQICEVDSDCEGLLQGCSTDPTSTVRLHCACITPATSASRTGGQGVCLGVPRDPTDCNACGDSNCIRPRFSSAGPGGVPATRALCVPDSFGTCRSDEECHWSGSHTVCTFFGWTNGPQPAGWPEGLFSACATPSVTATLGYGDECEPDDPLQCETGLCVASTQGRHRCTFPCDGSDQCEGSMSACLEGVARLGRSTDPVLWDVARLCGQGPSLGDECEPGDSVMSTCSTDAPSCVPSTTGDEHCSRQCRKDSDCGSDALFSCTTGFCRR